MEQTIPIGGTQGGVVHPQIITLRIPPIQTVTLKQDE